MGAKASLVLIDDMGRTTNRQYEMEDQTLLADYLTALGLFLTDYQAVTDLGCTRVELNILVTGETWAVTSGANVDVGAKATGILAGDEGRKYSLAIPGIKPALHGSDGTVPVDSGAVKDFLDNFLTAGDFSVAHGQTVSEWLKARMDK